MLRRFVVAADQIGLFQPGDSVSLPDGSLGKVAKVDTSAKVVEVDMATPPDPVKGGAKSVEISIPGVVDLPINKKTGV